MRNFLKLLFALFAIPVTGFAQSPGWLSLATDEAGLGGQSVFCISVADINNDSYPDLAVIKGGWSVTAENMIRLYLNVPDSAGNGQRKFVDITDGSGVNDRPGSMGSSKGTLVIALADVNNDGNIDLVRGNYYHRLSTFIDQGDRCEVLLGNGSGKFALVPGNGLHELGLVNAIGMSFLDYDKDGNIDLFIASYSKDHDNDIWTPGYLMKGSGDGRFTDVTAQAGINQAEPMYGSTVVDWNNDGWPDIVTAPYCRTGGKLWKNNGNGTFTNVAAQAGYNARYMPGDNGQNLCMWSNVPEDFDNDGDMDFFFALVHGGTGANEGRSAVALNNGPSAGYSLTVNRDITVRKAPQSPHLGDYDASWFDLDNDGKMDLAMAQGHYYPNTDRLYVFRQEDAYTLTDIVGDIGMVIPETNNLHLLEVMDFDLDGDDDIILCRDAAPQQMHLLRNNIGQSNNWTAVNLRAPGGVNKSCIGARIHVWAGGVHRVREVYAGRGNASGQQPFALIFGLGQSASIDSIQVSWPDIHGTVTTVRHPPANRYLEIGSDGLTVPDQDFPESGKAIQLYPNPAQGYVLVKAPGNGRIREVRMFDMLGREVESRELKNPVNLLYHPLDRLETGRYVIRIRTDAGQVYFAALVHL